MRTLIALALTCVLWTIVATAASPASASTPTERVAAVRTFVKISQSYQQARLLAVDRGQAAAEQVRTRAAGCLDVWRTVPRSRMEEAGGIYFVAVAGGLWSVDSPLFAKWIARLNASRAIARSPLLAAAVKRLQRELPIADRLYGSFPDPCATVTAWRDAGWAPAAAPSTFATGGSHGPTLGNLDEANADAGRQLDRYGDPDQESEDYLGSPTDEVDAEVIPRCDPVSRIVIPDASACLDEG